MLANHPSFVQGPLRGSVLYNLAVDEALVFWLVKTGSLPGQMFSIVDSYEYLVIAFWTFLFGSFKPEEITSLRFPFRVLWRKW